MSSLLRVEAMQSDGDEPTPPPMVVDGGRQGVGLRGSKLKGFERCVTRCSDFPIWFDEVLTHKATTFFQALAIAIA